MLGLVVAGVVSGVVSQALLSPGSVPLDWIAPAFSVACEAPDSLPETLAPGFVFALMLSPVLAARAGIASPFKRALVFVAGGTIAWYAAYRLFLLLADLANDLAMPEAMQSTAIGMIAGMVGALLLCAAVALAFPRTRLVSGTAVVIAGTLAGAGASFYELCGAGGFAFFALWQGAVAGSVAIPPGYRTRYVTH